LDELRSQGHITVESTWKSLFQDHLATDERFTNMLGQPGSTPLDLFKFYIDEMKSSFQKHKRIICALLDAKSIKNIPDTLPSFESFSELLADEDGIAEMELDELEESFKQLTAEITHAPDIYTPIHLVRKRNDFRRKLDKYGDAKARQYYEECFSDEEEWQDFNGILKEWKDNFDEIERQRRLSEEKERIRAEEEEKRLREALAERIKKEKEEKERIEREKEREKEFSDDEEYRRFNEDRQVLKNVQERKVTKQEAKDEYSKDYEQFMKLKRKMEKQAEISQAWGGQIEKEQYRKKHRSNDSRESYRDYDAPELTRKVREVSSSEDSSESDRPRHVFVAKKSKKHKKDKKMKKAIQKELKREFEMKLVQKKSKKNKKKKGKKKHVVQSSSSSDSSDSDSSSDFGKARKILLKRH